jgi:hypothetical protein
MECGDLSPLSTANAEKLRQVAALQSSLPAKVNGRECFYKVEKIKKKD